MDHTPMQFDMNISVGNLLTAGAMLVAIFGYLIRKDKRSDIQFMALHSRMEQLEKSHLENTIELRKIGDILIVMAKYDQKFLNYDERLSRDERFIDELRHGKGLIT